METCTFFLRISYPSASDYYIEWETDGIQTEVWGMIMNVPTSYMRATLTEGQHLFLDRNQPDEEYERSCMLIRMPTGQAFTTFCEEAERKAGQAVFKDRVAKWQDYADGLDGAWLKPFAVRIWREDEKPRPKNLQEALSLFNGA